MKAEGSEDFFQSLQVTGLNDFDKKSENSEAESGHSACEWIEVVKRFGWKLKDPKTSFKV